MGGHEVNQALGDASTSLATTVVLSDGRCRWHVISISDPGEGVKALSRTARRQGRITPDVLLDLQGEVFKLLIAHGGYLGEFV